MNLLLKVEITLLNYLRLFQDLMCDLLVGSFSSSDT
jgi:hypothetical protein